MQANRRFIAILIFILTMPFAVAAHQEPKSFVTSANGEGILKVGREVFDVHAVVVKLLEDGKAEISLVSDITIFVTGTWSGGDVARKEIDVQITGGATQGGLEGSGKLFLRDDKTLLSLTLQAVNKASKRNIQVNFRSKLK